MGCRHADHESIGQWSWLYAAFDSTPGDIVPAPARLGGWGHVAEWRQARLGELSARDAVILLDEFTCGTHGPLLRALPRVLELFASHGLEEASEWELGSALVRLDRITATRDDIETDLGRRQLEWLGRAPWRMAIPRVLAAHLAGYERLTRGARPSMLVTMTPGEVGWLHLRIAGELGVADALGRLWLDGPGRLALAHLDAARLLHDVAREDWSHEALEGACLWVPELSSVQRAHITRLLGPEGVGQALPRARELADRPEDTYLVEWGELYLQVEGEA